MSVMRVAARRIASSPRRPARVEAPPTTAVPQTPALAAMLQRVVGSPGRELDAGTRAFMEPRFGHDLGGGSVAVLGTPQVPARWSEDRTTPDEQEADATADRVTRLSGPPSGERYDLGGVRIHSDPEAAESARLLNADAFTVGNHIAFATGEYAPHTPAGRNLLAHELTHVVQQSGRGAAQRTGAAASSSAVSRRPRATGPRLQGRWRLDQATSADGVEIAFQRGNASVMSIPIGAGAVGGVLGRATTWQETGFVHQQVGGAGQVAHWVTSHFIFRNDGRDSDFLQLGVSGVVAGNAKAEDLEYARGAAAISGQVIERTAASPTPPGRSMFAPLEDGGISAATVGDLGLIEAEIPLGEQGSVHVSIPLKKVDEGTFVPFSGSTQPVHEVPGTIDEVDVFLGARIEVDASIETALTGLAPWISRNFNRAFATAYFTLNWANRAAPAPRPAAGTQPAPLGTPATAADEILHRAPDSRESASRLARKAEEAEQDARVGLHGVSAFNRPLDRPASQAARSAVEREFRVVNTLGPTHRTIVLPKPVTAAVAATFNRVFGRR